MASNIFKLPFEEELEITDPIPDFMVRVTEFCEENGVDVSTSEYKHKAAVIMTQLQVILRGL